MNNIGFIIFLLIILRSSSAFFLDFNIINYYPPQLLSIAIIHSIPNPIILYKHKMVKPRQHIASSLNFDEFNDDDALYIHAGIIVALNNSPIKDNVSIDLDVNFGFFFHNTTFIATCYILYYDITA